MAANFANSASAVAVLKELYVDNSDYMRDMVYAENPWFAMVPKDEAEDGFEGKYKKLYHYSVMNSVNWTKTVDAEMQIPC